MSRQERVKGRFQTHVCETDACACYQCSACDRRIAYKPSFVKHQLFSECTPHLTPELKASDLARENRHRVQVPNPGDSDGCAGVTGDSDPNCDGGEGSGGQGTAPGHSTRSTRNFLLIKPQFSCFLTVCSYILVSPYWLFFSFFYK